MGCCPGSAGGTGARGRRCGGGAAGGRPRRLTSNKIGQPAEGRKRVRRALRDRRVRDLGRSWGSPRGRTGSGRAGLRIGCPARLTCAKPPTPSTNRKRAAGESHSRPTTAWGVPKTPPAIRRLGDRSPVVVAWSSQCSPPARGKGRGKILRCSPEMSVARPLNH